MNNGKISIRYARALYAYALERGEDKAVYDDMRLVADSLAGVKELAGFLANPAAGSEDKERMLLEAAGGDRACECTRRFMRFALAKNRAASMRMIALMYAKLYREKNHIVTGHVTSAAELPSETEEKIAASLRGKYGMDVEMSAEVDPSLIGGFILDVDNRRLDASVAGQLQKLNNYAGH